MDRFGVCLCLIALPLWCMMFHNVQARICRGMTIMNDVENLERLRNCTRILGSLKIYLMERIRNESDYDEYEFSTLTHINGYLLLYSMAHLTSVGKIFPNLRMIGGMELLTDYSLILHQMQHLREIGTTNLLFIARGYVKVDRCPLLCYVDTIDWSRIGDVRLHFNNMNSEGCESCPKMCGGYCWNAMNCQNTEADKCHEECLGCSKKKSARHCDACKNYEFNKTCVPECPLNTFAHTRCYKCVTANDCRHNVFQIKGEWWPFENECVDDCPAQYERNYDKEGNIICRNCGENCTKHCNVTEEVDTMDKLQKLKGCTHIHGSLVLKLADIDPSRIIGDLDKFLGSVRYIRDSLVIGRSEAVTSLVFLQNLTLIEGKKLENQHAVFIYDNENLQMLWNFSDPHFNLTIKNGSFAFHDNPLLCVSEIMKLASYTGANYSEVDVSVYSNGDKAACNKTDILVDFEITAHSVNMSWKQQVCHGECIGYTIFYRPVGMQQTVTGFDSKNECLDTKWNSTFTSKNCTVLKELNAYTRYAYYIKIYHQKTRQLTQSNINYFVTKPDAPGDPEFLNSRALDSHTIRLEWRRPSQINGNLSKYIVHIDTEPDNMDLKNLRNYCDDPITLDGDKIDKDSKLFMNKDIFDLYLENLGNQENTDPMRDKKCFCKTRKKPNPEWFKDLSIVKVDRYLHICDLHSLSKFGFDECKAFVYLSSNDTSSSSNQSKEFYVEKRSQVKSLRSPEVISPNATAYNFTQLNYFSLYVFYFSACNEINGDLRCSGVEQTFARTKPKKDADDIEEIRVNVEDNSLVRISWTEPKHPNSMILAYKITYVEKGQEDAARRVKCIPRDDKFNASEWILTNLSPGVYTITVQADSLGGPGRPSREETFEIAAPRNDITTIILWICVVAVMTAIGTFLGIYWWKRTHPQRTFRDINPEYHGLEYEADDWEIERNDVDLQSDLGHGTFGTVYYGKVKSKNTLCAIKTANESMSIKDRMEFLNEASVMKAFSNCHHVVRLLGVVSKGKPPLVIMELMERGDLKKYLHRTRDSSHTLTSNEIYRMAVEIADGMAYLAAKKFVHRDLAARNCMVASDRTVKIGDFGMARDIYETDYYKKGTKGLLPVRWMAPESLADGVFTSDSDAWSYGIVLWEIATLAEQPYQGMSNEQVLQFVVSKGRLERPQECSDLFYEVMRQCWSWKPIDRPTFWDIVEKLEDHVGENFKVVSFIHSREGTDHRIIHGRARPYNPPAVCIEREEDLIGHYNVSDDEVSLHVGTAPHRPSFLQSSLSQSRDSRSSPSDFY